MTADKNFIDLHSFSYEQLRKMVDEAIEFKRCIKLDSHKDMLKNKNIAMIFEKSSTRTRISFEVAIRSLGGNALIMNKSDIQLENGESISDTAKVISRMVDAVMIRCYEHSTLIEFAKNGNIPVINGLSNFSHPCQVMASIMTIEEKLGNINNLVLAWFGDANNVLNSYIHACAIFGFRLNIAKPNSYSFSNNEIVLALKRGAKIFVTDNPREAAQNADVLITDTWFSMGDNSIKEKKLRDLLPYQVNKDIFAFAKKGAIFTHCLPLYRGHEVSADVADGANSVIFDEAENRLHVQKSILKFCLNP
jgi:ornithine carbamoyltransferase